MWILDCLSVNKSFNSWKPKPPSLLIKVRRISPRASNNFEPGSPGACVQSGLTFKVDQLISFEWQAAFGCFSASMHASCNTCLFPTCCVHYTCTKTQRQICICENQPSNKILILVPVYPAGNGLGSSYIYTSQSVHYVLVLPDFYHLLTMMRAQLQPN